MTPRPFAKPILALSLAAGLAGCSSAVESLMPNQFSQRSIEGVQSHQGPSGEAEKIKVQPLNSNDLNCPTIDIADGGATGVTRFIDAFGGAGYQQIALSTDDIFGFVARARARGVAFLPIPDNYYDDIDSRYQLDPALLRSMKDNGILYDRDDTGEFFQVYTHAFDERFFFEIVQRRNYHGFGAANAPIRLAAQTRLARNRRREEREE